MSLLRIENLSVDFVSENETTQAVKNISLTIDHGEIVALVPEKLIKNLCHFIKKFVKDCGQVSKMVLALMRIIVTTIKN